MPTSKAQQRAVARYVKENYDMYQIRMPKGKKREIQAHAEAQGESVNGFINRAISETMERDKAPQRPQEAQTATAVQDTTPALQTAQEQPTGATGTEGIPLHTLEQRVRRILYKHGATIRKDRKSGAYTVVYEDKSLDFPDFTALLDYAQGLGGE